MKLSHKLSLGVSAAAFAVAIGSLPAAAFDDLQWNWTKSNTEQVTRDVQSSIDALPTGQVGVGAVQMQIGNPSAQSSADTQVTLPDPMTPGDAATDLGTAKASAGAYGNVQTIDSAVSLSTNVGQFQFGGVDPAAATTATVDPSLDPATLNSNHVLMNELRDQAATGAITPHQTSATADAIGAKDVLVDVEANAISNSISTSLTAAPATPLTSEPVLDATTGDVIYPIVTDALLTGDTTQFSYGDVSASGTSSQTLDNLNNLGGLSGPVNNVNATAIGNMGSTKVDVSAPTAP